MLDWHGNASAVPVYLYIRIDKRLLRLGEYVLQVFRQGLPAFHTTVNCFVRKDVGAFALYFDIASLVQFFVV